MSRSQPGAGAPLGVRLAQSAILAAAIDVFRKKGIAATRVEDLLEAAGIARRTFYKYFSGKEDVLTALYELATAELLGAMAGEGDADPLATIRRGIDVYLEYHARNAALLRLLVEQAIRSDSPLSPLRRRFRGRLMALLDQAARALGHAPDPLLYTALLSALEGVSLQILEDGGPPAEIARAKRVIHTILERVLARGADQQGA